MMHDPKFQDHPDWPREAPRSLLALQGADEHVRQAAQDLFDDLGEDDRIGFDGDIWGDARFDRVIANIELRIRQAIEHIEQYAGVAQDKSGERLTRRMDACGDAVQGNEPEHLVRPEVVAETVPPAPSSAIEAR